MKSWLPLLVLATQSVTATGLVAAARAAESSPAMPTVNGTVLFGPQKAKVTQLYVSRKKTDEGPVTALVFASAPLPLRALEDRQKLLQLARKGAFVGVYAEIDGAGELKMTELFHQEGAFSGPWRFEAAKGKTGALAGRIATEGEREFFGKPYGVDFQFKTDGKATEAWSGSPFLETKATGLASGQAQGWMERAGKKTEFAHAVGLAQGNLFGESSERILLLSAQPVTDAMLAGPMGPEQALHEAGIAFLKIRLDAKGEIESMMTPSANGNAMSFSGNQWSVELVATPASELEGYLEALDPRDASSEFPRFQLRFRAGLKATGPAAPVTAENGKPLPKDGGEPGKAYRDFSKALKTAKTLDELVPLRAKGFDGQLKAIPAAERGAMLEFLQAESATPLTVTGGFAHATQATLWLERRQGDVHLTGRVNVHLEDGRWKLGEESIRIRDGQ